MAQVHFITHSPKGWEHIHVNANEVTIVNVRLKYISSPVSVAVYMSLHSYLLDLSFVLFFEEGFLAGIVLV